ncbi:MAG: hypothetical protein KDC74_06835 [Flavobacteriaceae bacterium]|nr:hypothetical protein [Flavobacteriaceae bacterium]MCB0486734.1 hypothetical protein [Flavobacteriaceae bacterium]
MKNIILTIDYELFFGNVSGSVASCMIEPTKRLSDILASNNSKMTIYWDVLHFFKLKEYEDSYPELKKDRVAIEEQIIDLTKQGHDVQLHLHPHWLDSEYEKGKWNFSYKRFKLHELSKTDNESDINTIVGCVTQACNLINDILKPVAENFELFSYRAGGYLVEPFATISKALLKNGIYVDSSICPGLENTNNIFPYDFRNYPNKTYYKFEDSPAVESDKGAFIEIPIHSIKVPLYKRLYFTFLKRTKYKDIEAIKKGVGSSSAKKKEKKNITNKIQGYISDKEYQKLTTDNSFREKYLYLLNRSPNLSTQIMHPKMLNKHTLYLYNEVIDTNMIKFMSVKDFRKLKEI